MMARSKVMRSAALLAQWRAPEPYKAVIKSARKGKRVESITALIMRFVTHEDLRKIKRRGCLHAVDFPEKRDLALRTGEGK